MLTALLMVVGSHITRADEYQLVKSASELEVDDIVLITNGIDGTVKAMGGQNTNNRYAVDVIISDEKITDKGSAVEITLKSKTAKGYSFQVGNKYLYAANTSSGSNNYLKQTTSSSVYWSIAINTTTYAASILDKSSDCNNHNMLRYYPTLFSCYTSGTANIYLFKKVAASAKEDIELSFEDVSVQRLVSDGSYSQTAVVTEGYDGVVSYAITANTASATIEGATVSFENTGSVTVTATAPATEKYNGDTASYTLTIKNTPTIAVSNQEITYGANYTLDTSDFLSGTVSIASANELVATVDNLTLTSLAAGSTTITVTTAENDTYIAGEETFTLTVTQPEASSTKPIGAVTVFEEDFNTINGYGGNDGQWNGLSTSAGKVDTWAYENAFGSKQCVRCGTGSEGGYAQTPAFTLEDGVEYTLTFKAGAWDASGEGTTLSLSATNASLGNTSVTLKKGKWTEYEVTISGASSAVKVKFYTSSGNNRFFLDEVKISKNGGTTSTVSVTTSGGFATYCYLYPLNLNGVEGAKAYKVSSVDLANERIFLTQLTGTIQGGVPFILKADGEDDTFEIPLAESSTNVPEDNALLGTLAPTFVPQTSGNITNFAYSKTKECFVKIGSAGNTVPANRAYLPVNIGSEVKSFSFVFTDTDGISALRVKNEVVENEVFIFNLAGQRMSKLLKGVNIVNGKKRFVK